MALRRSKCNTVELVRKFPEIRPYDRDSGVVTEETKL
jgi:hypothetical protein